MDQVSEQRVQREAQQTPPVQRGTPIELLPDSILLDIFEYDWGGVFFPPDHGLIHEHERESTTRAISRVCKRWHEVADRILYRYVNLHSNKHRCRLYGTLERRPELRSLTRRVRMTVGIGGGFPTTERDTQELGQMLRWWRPSLKQVAINGWLENPRTRSVMLKLSQLPLENLNISGYSWGVSLNFFLKYFQFPGQKSLRFHHPFWREDRDIAVCPSRRRSEASWGPVHSAETYLPTDRQYVADIKHLIISVPECAPDAIALLLKWPRALESIQMLRLHHSPCDEKYTSAAVESLLSLQAHSLKTISISQMRNMHEHIPHTNNIPDFSSLTRLENLTLSNRNIFSTPPLAACAKLAAPNLTRLTIHFYSTEPRHEENSHTCTSNEWNWLVQFAKGWNSMNTQHCSLEQVHIDVTFAPPESRLSLAHTAWPYRYLDLARRNMKSDGSSLRLTWDGDEQSFQEWKDSVIAKIEEIEARKAQEAAAYSYKAECRKIWKSYYVWKAKDYDDWPPSQFREYNKDPRQQRVCRMYDLRLDCIH